jgi:ABC-type multidrug transport system fused ATPase/permease subunit
VNLLQRLLGYARPYRGRFAVAVAMMTVYAAASAMVAYQIKPMIDDVLTQRTPFMYFAGVVLGAYVLKGLGAYFSVYLMTDVGQRVVRDLRNELFRHTLDQSAAFFSRRSSGQLMSRITNDVNQVQQAVSEPAVRARLAAGDRQRDRRADLRLSAGAARAARPADDAPQPGGTRKALSHHRGGVHRSPHRESVRRRRT